MDDALMKIERVGDGIKTSCYYIVTINELDEIDKEHSRYTGDTVDEAIDKAMVYLRKEKVQRYDDGPSLDELKKQREVLNVELTHHTEELNKTREENEKVVQKILRYNESPPLEIIHVLDDIEALKMAAKWLDPNLKRNAHTIEVAADNKWTNLTMCLTLRDNEGETKNADKNNEDAAVHTDS